MRLYTSYFANYRDPAHAVAVSATVPKGFAGRRVRAVAPPYDLVQAYKNGEISKECYINQYKYQLRQLGDLSGYFRDGDVLLCWERNGKFCHRHILAEYLERTLDVEVREL